MNNSNKKFKIDKLKYDNWECHLYLVNLEMMLLQIAIGFG